MEIFQQPDGDLCGIGLQKERDAFGTAFFVPTQSRRERRGCLLQVSQRSLRLRVS